MESITVKPTEFYFTGGTLKQNVPSYVRRQADDILYEAITGRKFCYVLTSRQMGKSSLMIRTAVRLRHEGAAKVVTLDLQKIGQNVTVEQWYYGLLTTMAEQLSMEDELDDFWNATETRVARLAPLQRWMRSIREVVLEQLKSPLVIFIDEIDYVRSLSFSTDELFAAVRECYTGRAEDTRLEKLTFCLLGVATPSDLIRNVFTTPFNIGERIELNDFTPTEAGPLAVGLGRSEAVNRQLLERVLYWTNGHPYLTQKFCYVLAKDKSIVSNTGVDHLCDTLFLSLKARQQDDNLIFVRDRMLKDRTADEVDSLLDLYQKACLKKNVPAEEKNPFVATLRLSGITRVEKGQLRVRNNIYRNIFDRKWIDANRSNVEALRRRDAYRKGLVRSTVISLFAISILGSLYFAQISANKAQQEAIKSKNAQLMSQQLIAQKNYELEQLNNELEKQKDTLQWTLAARESDLERVKVLQRLALENADKFKRVNNELVEEANRAEVNFLLYKANEAIDHENDSYKGLSILKTAWQKNTSDAGVLATFNKAIPFKALPNTLHAAPVRTASFSPDGSKIITASDDRTVKVVSKEGKEILVLKGFKSPVHYAAFSSNGKLLLTLCENECRIWTTDGKELPNYNLHESYINTAAFSPDNQSVLTASRDSTARVWTLDGRHTIVLSGHHGEVTRAVFSKTGKNILTASADGTAKLWDLQGHNTVTYRGQTSKVNDVSFSPDEKRVLTAAGDELSLTSDNRAVVWDIGGEKLLTLNGHTEPVLIARFSPSGNFVATGSVDNKVILWDRNGKPIKTLGGHSSKILDLRFSKDEKKIVTASADKTAKLWSVNGEELATFPHGGGVNSISFSPDEEYILTSSADNTYRLWQTNGTERTFIVGHKNSFVNTAVFSPDGSRILTVSDDKTAIVWDAEGREGKVVAKHADVIKAGSFSSDGKLVVTASGDQDKTVKVWDIGGKRLATLEGHTGRVNSVVFSPNGETVLTASADGTVKEWLWRKEKCVRTLRHPSEVLSAIFLQGGHLVLTSCRDNKIRYWKADNQEPRLLKGIASPRSLTKAKYENQFLVCSAKHVFLCDTAGSILETYGDQSSSVNSAAYSSDFNEIVTAADDGTVKVWNKTGNLLLSLQAHKSPVNSAAFSPDGTRIITASDDGLIKLWFIKPSYVFAAQPSRF